MDNLDYKKILELAESQEQEIDTSFADNVDKIVSCMETMLQDAKQDSEETKRQNRISNAVSIISAAVAVIALAAQVIIAILG